MFLGINLSGLQDGSEFKQKANTDYNVPKSNLPTDWLALGFKAARIPHNMFRMQPGGKGTAFNETYLNYSLSLAKPYLDNRGFALLEPHSFGSVQTSGTTLDILTEPGRSQYLDYMARLAAAVKQWMGKADKWRIAIGLMNEPHQHSNADYTPLWNDAIAAMRGAGYKGVIAVPCASWQNASQFNSSNAPLPVVDHVGPTVLEVHCYLDNSNAGSGDASTDEQTGVKRFQGLMNAKLPDCYSGVILGETGCPSDAVSVATLKNMLTYLKDYPQFLGAMLWCDDKWLAKNGNYTQADRNDPRVAAMLEVQKEPGRNPDLTRW